MPTVKELMEERENRVRTLNATFNEKGMSVVVDGCKGGDLLNLMVYIIVMMDEGGSVPTQKILAELIVLVAIEEKKGKQNG